MLRADHGEYRLPGGILNIYIWISIKGITTFPNQSGCTNNERPVSWYYLPYIFQAIFDLLVFLLCTIKVRFPEGYRI
jgi:hypothetical protein